MHNQKRYGSDSSPRHTDPAPALTEQPHARILAQDRPLTLATIPLGEWIAETVVIALVAILTATPVLEDRSTARPQPEGRGPGPFTSTTWDNRPRD